MVPSPRRSARRRKTKTNYADWDNDTIDSLRGSSSPERRQLELEPQRAEEPQDVFIPDDEDETLDVDQSAIESEGQEQEQSGTRAVSNARTNGIISRKIPRPKKSAKRRADTIVEHDTHKPLQSTGGEDILRSRSQQGTYDKLRSAKDKVHTANYGPLLEDLYPVLQARDLWLKGRDATLPSRRTLMEALSLSSKNQYPNIKAGPAQAECASLDLGANQLLEPLAEEAARPKYCSAVAAQHQVVLGPFSTSTKHRLDENAPLNTNKAWSTHQDTHASWLINVGAKPLAMSWAPSAGEPQYVAVSLKSSQTQRGVKNLTSSQIAPAFVASTPYPASTQIWRVYSHRSVSHKISPLDYTRTPELSQVICTDWGDCTQIEWHRHTQDPAGDTQSLGILSTDGIFRVVVINLSTAATTYLRVQTPSRVAYPQPQTIFTCFCFATASDLILGCADGTVQLFGLHEQDLSPYATIQIHATYIMGLTVAPEYPHYLSTTSAGGELTLTDLRNPTQERVPVHRSRLATRNMCYLPLTRHFVTTSDSSGNSETYGTTVSTVTAHNLRHYYQGTTLLKLPESAGIATALATSTFHPTVLAANAAGSVFATNYLRKVLPLKRSEGGTQAYMHKVFEYDWQPQQETDYRDTSDVSLYHGRDVRPGLSRFHEIFKPEKVSLATPSARGTAGEKGAMKDTADGGSTTQIVLPEEQAVTTMCWNSDPKRSSWVAIGWGSGLIRILDLSHDMV